MDQFVAFPSFKAAVFFLHHQNGSYHSYSASQTDFNKLPKSARHLSTFLASVEGSGLNKNNECTSNLNWKLKRETA